MPTDPRFFWHVTVNIHIFFFGLKGYNDKIAVDKHFLLYQFNCKQAGLKTITNRGNPLEYYLKHVSQ
jgi:hypothetical protein